MSTAQGVIKVGDFLGSLKDKYIENPSLFYSLNHRAMFVVQNSKPVIFSKDDVIFALKNKLLNITVEGKTVLASLLNTPNPTQTPKNIIQKLKDYSNIPGGVVGLEKEDYILLLSPEKALGLKDEVFSGNTSVVVEKYLDALKALVNNRINIAENIFSEIYTQTPTNLRVLNYYLILRGYEAPLSTRTALLLPPELAKKTIEQNCIEVFLNRDMSDYTVVAPKSHIVILLAMALIVVFIILFVFFLILTF